MTHVLWAPRGVRRRSRVTRRARPMRLPLWPGASCFHDTRLAIFSIEVCQAFTDAETLKSV